MIVKYKNEYTNIFLESKPVYDLWFYLQKYMDNEYVYYSNVLKITKSKHELKERFGNKHLTYEFINEFLHHYKDMERTFKGKVAKNIQARKLDILLPININVKRIGFKTFDKLINNIMDEILQDYQLMYFAYITQEGVGKYKLSIIFLDREFHLQEVKRKFKRHKTCWYNIKTKKIVKNDESNETNPDLVLKYKKGDTYYKYINITKQVDIEGITRGNDPIRFKRIMNSFKMHIFNLFMKLPGANYKFINYKLFKMSTYKRKYKNKKEEWRYITNRIESCRKDIFYKQKKIRLINEIKRYFNSILIAIDNKIYNNLITTKLSKLLNNLTKCKIVQLECILGELYRKCNINTIKKNASKLGYVKSDKDKIYRLLNNYINSNVINVLKI